MGRFRVTLYRRRTAWPDEVVAVQDFASYLSVNNAAFSISRTANAYYYVRIDGTAGFGRTVGYVTLSGSNAR